MTPANVHLMKSHLAFPLMSSHWDLKNSEIFGMELKGLAMRIARQPFQHLTAAAFWRLMAGMKHYFLFSIAIPDRSKSDIWQLWLGFLHKYPTHKKAPEGTQRLAENVWLIDRATGVTFLSHLVSEADGCGLNPQVRFLMEETDSEPTP
jgi:hypothetical protein